MLYVPIIPNIRSDPASSGLLGHCNQSELSQNVSWNLFSNVKAPALKPFWPQIDGKFNGCHLVVYLSYGTHNGDLGYDLNSSQALKPNSPLLIENLTSIKMDAWSRRAVFNILKHLGTVSLKKIEVLLRDEWPWFENQMFRHRIVSWIERINVLGFCNGPLELVWLNVIVQLVFISVGEEKKRFEKRHRKSTIPPEMGRNQAPLCGGELNLAPRFCRSTTGISSRKRCLMMVGGNVRVGWISGFDKIVRQINNRKKFVNRVRGW